jgi:hypothetical protein
VLGEGKEAEEMELSDCVRDREEEQDQLSADGS